MDLKSILLHADRDPHFDGRLRIAIQLAARHAAHLIGVFAYGPPLFAGYTDPYVASEMIQMYRAEVEAAAKALKPKFDKAAASAGVSYEWRAEEAAMDLGGQARYADLAIVGQTDPDDPGAQRVEDFVQEVIMTSGGPVLAVPYAGRFDNLGKRVLIAWNGTRESARAVRDAMVFLRDAESVVVYSVNAPDEDHIPGTDIATHLARHDIKVDVERTVAKDIEVGDALLSAVADRGIDLLVMGAYGHSRFREFVLGGATRHLLQHMTAPTLFSH
jgi:nucleotide-binding universal stress UspA family protein